MEIVTWVLVTYFSGVVVETETTFEKIRDCDNFVLQSNGTAYMKLPEAQTIDGRRFNAIQLGGTTKDRGGDDFGGYRFVELTEVVRPRS